MPMGSYVGRGRVWGRCEESIGAVAPVDEGSGSALLDVSGAAVVVVVAAVDVVAVAVTVAVVVTIAVGGAVAIGFVP